MNLNPLDTKLNDTRNNLIIDYSTRKILDVAPKSTELEQKKGSPKIQFVPENFNIIKEGTARTKTPEPLFPSQVERKLEAVNFRHYSNHYFL